MKTWPKLRSNTRPEKSRCSWLFGSLFLAGITAFVCGCTVSSESIPEAAEPSAPYENYADDFLAVWDRTRGDSPEARREAFRREIFPLFAAFYEAERFQSEEFGSPTLPEVIAYSDSRIDDAFENFEEMREAYVDKMRQFDSGLANAISDFKQTFPDFKLRTKIYLLHSLGEMDGGTRTLNGETVLIFGADGMAKFHSFGDERAFFLHELFHVYHQSHFGPCNEIWCDAWREGLAVYASEQLVPEASPIELLIDYPIGTLARVDSQLLTALIHLQDVGNCSDQNIYSALFQTSQDETSLPPRRGYYLGYLIAKEAGQELTVSQLAALSASEVRPIFERSIHNLIVRYTALQ